MISRTLLIALLSSSLIYAQTQPLRPRGLSVTVLQGERITHHLPDPVSAHLSIRVADSEGKPIRGAVAVFELPEQGASATAMDGSQVKVVLTDKDGAATCEIKANKLPGEYIAKITVNYLGQTSTVSLHQENAFGAAIRPAVYQKGFIRRPTRSSSSSIFSNKKTWLVIGAAAGLAVIFATQRGSTTNPGGGIILTPGSGSVGGK